jgi:tRNA pseudouridine38-40 synthase
VPTFKVTLAYDGTGLVGWQRQAHGTSIQGLLEEALTTLDGRAVSVVGAGRTDAGVHALGQVASATLVRAMDPRTLMAALNAHLPSSVRVLAADEAPVDFHPRFHARTKTYTYRIWNAEALSPFERLYAWHLPAPILHVEAMATAAEAIVGGHDFAAFQAAGSESSSTTRSMHVSSVSRAGALVTYEVTGDGFLRHMVRNLVGSLVEVGRGKRSPAWLTEVLESRDRSRAGPTAPAGGLFLTRVDYDAPGSRP